MCIASSEMSSLPCSAIFHIEAPRFLRFSLGPAPISCHQSLLYVIPMQLILFESCNIIIATIVHHHHHHHHHRIIIIITIIIASCLNRRVKWSRRHVRVRGVENGSLLLLKPVHFIPVHCSASSSHHHHCHHHHFRILIYMDPLQN